jgi:hypothetical protein
VRARAAGKAARIPRRGRRGPASPSRRPPVVAIAVVAAAALLALAPIDAAWLDRVYSRGWYAALQPWVTAVSSAVPFALLDGWIGLGLAVVAWQLWRVVRAPAGARGRAAAGSLWRLAVAGAAVYLAFLASWGLNYRRLPVTAGLDFDAARVTPAAVERASRQAVDALNRLHTQAHADLAAMPTVASVRTRLAPAFAKAQRALGADHLARPGRPKTSLLLSPFFRWAAVDGMVNPLGLEVIVNPELLPVERPFVVAHEWGHLAGRAHESEASYVGWLTCREGDAAARYSGWLSLFWHLRGDVPRDRLTAIERGLTPGPRKDLAEIAARLRRGQPLVQEASWRAYDQYLKANRVDAGIQSYSDVVTLVLGVAPGDDGRPRRR